MDFSECIMSGVWPEDGWHLRIGISNCTVPSHHEICFLLINALKLRWQKSCTRFLWNKLWVISRRMDDNWKGRQIWILMMKCQNLKMQISKVHLVPLNLCALCLNSGSFNRVSWLKKLDQAFASGIKNIHVILSYVILK